MTCGDDHWIHFSQEMEDPRCSLHCVAVDLEDYFIAQRMILAISDSSHLPPKPLVLNLHSPQINDILCRFGINGHN
jgi:hypothetical protein